MRLIEEKVLKEYQMQIPPEWLENHLNIVKGMIEIFTNAIEAQPIIDAEPVIHAHWITGNRKWKKCSNCFRSNQYYSKYCPWCGAKMDEEVKK